MGQPFIGSDNGYGWLRQPDGSYDLTYIGSGTHNNFNNVVEPQSPTYTDPNKSILLPLFMDASKPADSLDGGVTWTQHTGVVPPVGYTQLRSPAKIGLNYPIDEVGIAWATARKTSDSSIWVVKSTDYTATVFTPVFNGSAVFGWVSPSQSSLFVTGGKIWWLDRTNCKLKRCDTDGTNYSEWLIDAVPSYPCNITLDGVDQHVADGADHLVSWSASGATNFPFAGGTELFLPRSGTWGIEHESVATWSHGAAIPPNCYHTAQSINTHWDAPGSGIGTGDVIYTPGDGIPTAVGAHGENLGNGTAGFLTLSIGSFPDDISGITRPISDCGDTGTGALWAGAAAEDGRSTVRWPSGFIMGCGQRIHCNENYGTGFSANGFPFSAVSHFMDVSGYHASIAWQQPTDASIISRLTMSGWHNTGRLICWNWIGNGPTLSIDISSGAPVFQWSDSWDPFGTCHGAYDIQPADNQNLIANTLYIQSGVGRFTKGSIYLSTDGGETWSEIVAETTNLGNTNQDNEISCVAIDPEDINHVCVAIKPPYVYRSTSKGAGFTLETVSYGAVLHNPVEWCGIAIIGVSVLPGLAYYDKNAVLQWIKTSF